MWYRDLQKYLESKTSRMYCVREIHYTHNDMGIILYGQTLYEAKSYVQNMTGKIYSDIKLNKVYNSKYDEDVAYQVVLIRCQPEIIYGG